MSRIYLFAAALILSLAIAAPASAGCQNVTVGADISINAYFVDNWDYNDNASDGRSAIREDARIYIDNIYTEGVSTHIQLGFQGFLDDAGNVNIEVERAYIRMEEFLAKELTVQIGKFFTTWQLRGDMWGAGTFENIYPYALNQAFVLDQAAVGLGFYYDATEQVTLSFIWHKIAETNEAQSSDLDLLAIRIDYTIEGNNKVFGAFLYFNDQGDTAAPPVGAPAILNGNIWMLNAGIDYFLMEEEALELYFELVYQGGDAHNAANDLGTLAANLGAEFTFSDIETVPYIGLDITYFQGQDGTTFGYSRRYSNWNKTLIVENSLANAKNMDPLTTPGYMGVKLVGGMKNIMDEKIMIDFVFAWFKADGDLAGARQDGIGFEFDAVASYWYTEDVVFTLGLGYFVPDEDLYGFADPDAVMMAIFACTITF